jgi:hypothetical protein
MSSRHRDYELQKGLIENYNLSQSTMSSTEQQPSSGDDSRRRVIIGVAVIAALLIGALIYFLLRATGGGTPAPTLQGAIRPGSTEWNEYQPKIVLDPPEADEARRPLGDIVMTLRTVVRNFTGRTIDGLEVKGTVIDSQGQPVRERTVIVIPARQPELGPNKTMLVQVVIEGFKETDNRANIKMEITGFRLR